MRHINLTSNLIDQLFELVSTALRRVLQTSRTRAHANTCVTEATENERALFFVYILPLSQPHAGWKLLSIAFNSNYRYAATMREQPHAPAE